MGQRQRRDWAGVVYLLLALLMGAPGVAFSAGLLGSIIIFLFMPVQSLAGLLGLLSWVRLTFEFKWSGTAGLRQVRGFWWIFLLLGVLASWPQVVGLIEVLGRYNRSWGDVISNLLLGPILIPLAAYPVYLRQRKITTATA